MITNKFQINLGTKTFIYENILLSRKTFSIFGLLLSLKLEKDTKFEFPQIFKWGKKKDFSKNVVEKNLIVGQQPINVN